MARDNIFYSGNNNLIFSRASTSQQASIVNLAESIGKIDARLHVALKIVDNSK